MPVVTSNQQFEAIITCPLAIALIGKKGCPETSKMKVLFIKLYFKLTPRSFIFFFNQKKPIFENYASQYPNMKFVEAHYEDFEPDCKFVPDTCTGTSFSLPVIEVYKNGQRVDGMIGCRSQAQLQNLITKNGG